MSSSPKPRKRAVRLTEAAHAELLRALEAKWRADGLHPRFTREAKAEIMGVSLATAVRIVANEGVDRASLALAFKNLDLVWSDAVCARPADEETPSDSKPEPESIQKPSLDAAQEPAGFSPAPPPKSGPEPSAPLRTTARRSVFSAALLVLGLVTMAATAWRSAWGSKVPSLPEDAWIGLYDRTMAQATACYHKANYLGAQRNLDRAFALLNGHDSLRDLDGALKLSGEIAAARGDLKEAAERFRSAVESRRLLGRPAWAPLHEALGAVETRLRDFSRAEVDLRLALDGYRANREPVGVATASCNLGSLALAVNEFDAADSWLDKSLAAMGDHPDPDVVADVQGIRAMVLLGRGRASEAHRLLTESLAHWTKKGQPRWIALTEMRLGLTEERQGRTGTARARIAHSRDAFEGVGDEARVQEATLHLRRLSERRPLTLKIG